MLRRKRYSSGKLVLMALISVPCYLLSAELAVENSLLSSLEGSWRGEAVHTPVGPTPYNINFSRTGAGCVSGTADTGFSNHSWTFCPAEDSVVLNFLSDFRGNDDPIVLKPIHTGQGKVVFKSAKIAFMDVILTGVNSNFIIDIMHHGKLHVRIELRPADSVGSK